MVAVPDAFAPRRGDDCSFAIPVQNDDGTYADFTGAQVRWTYGLSADGPPLKVKTIGSELAIGKITVDGEEVPAILVVMPAAETLTLHAYRTYAFQCRVTFPDDQGGAITTVLTGTFTVSPTQ